MNKSTEFSRGTNMNDLFGFLQSIDQMQNIWPPLMMKSPHHAKEFPGHGKHGTAFRSIGARPEEAFHLPFECPPVVNEEWMVHKNNGVSFLETRFNLF